MRKFAERFPDRYFDVGIAEQHALTFAAGVACEGMKPVVAIYSTFLQRAYDQLIHDIQIQNLPVVFAIDRAGLVGADGATHNGSFDLTYLRCLPNMTVMTPADENECRQMLYTAFQMNARRWALNPRARPPSRCRPNQALPIGKGEVRPKLPRCRERSCIRGGATQARPRRCATVANSVVKPSTKPSCSSSQRTTRCSSRSRRT